MCISLVKNAYIIKRAHLENGMLEDVCISIIKSYTNYTSYLFYQGRHKGMAKPGARGSARPLFLPFPFLLLMLQPPPYVDGWSLLRMAKPGTQGSARPPFLPFPSPKVFDDAEVGLPLLMVVMTEEWQSKGREDLPGPDFYHSPFQKYC